MANQGVTRRGFLRQAGVSLTGAALVDVAARRTAYAATRRVSANERIALGFIGVGGMGRSHFDRLLRNNQVAIVAAADVDRQRQQAAKDKAAEAGVTIATHTDFRDMLEQHPTIDAVFIATPDHWHAPASTAAMKAGKDVYCERPLTLTIAEGRAMVETARRYARVVQAGTQQRSDQKQFLHACELVRNGRIGEVKRTVCFFGPNPRQDCYPDEDPPEYLDWDLWLGPAPWRPFNRCIHPYNFRFFRDYSGGLLADWGVHLLDIAQWGLGKDDTSPVRIEAEGAMFEDNLYDFPLTMQIVYDYGDCTIEWQQGMNEEFELGEGYGTKFYGTDGDLFVNRGGYKIHPRPGRKIDERIGPADIRLYDSPGHHQDFLDCMRTRKKPICDVEIAHRTTTISHLGNIAFRLGRPLRYDPANETFPNDPIATRMLSKPARAHGTCPYRS